MTIHDIVSVFGVHSMKPLTASEYLGNLASGPILPWSKNEPNLRPWRRKLGLDAHQFMRAVPNTEASCTSISV